MQERRNYYRILGVQPDAPVDVIRGAYRTLMQKLRMHPDLGGDQRNAAIINAAWELLRDPTRRAAYDQQLLAEYDIRLLASAGNPPNQTPVGNHGNRRNYYRVLGVQPDARQALIVSAYRTLSGTDPAENALLDEAYAVLGNPACRKQYDALLAGKKPADRPDDYVPSILSYCSFCKTPHSPYPRQSATEICCECNSPLRPTVPGLAGDGRSFDRLDFAGPVTFYEYWPSPESHGWLEEFTPDGMRMTVPRELEIGQTIRVTAAAFDAVARVVHCARGNGGFSCGMELLAATFCSSGVFVDVQS